MSNVPSTSDSSVTNAITTAVNNYNATGNATTSTGGNPPAYPINEADIQAIALQESNGNQTGLDGNILTNSNSNGTTDYGAMQLNSGSFPNASTLPLGSNVTTGVNYYGNNLQTFGGNVTYATAAYNAGAGNVQNSLSTTGGLSASQQAYVDSVASKGGTGSSIPSDVISAANTPLAPTATPYVPLTNNANQVNQASLVPPIIINEGLNTTPWYNDNGLITGNPRLRKQVQPVSFQVLLHDNKSFVLSSNGETGTPISVQLNASMKTVNWTMKHNYFHQRTRTAHHITLWGMNADIIEGTCSTGVFMNQFGITDYYSTRTINDQLKALVGQMFSTGTTATNTNLSGNPSLDLSPFNSVTTVLGPNGQSVVSATGNPQFSNTINAAARNNPNFSTDSVFRVAAQDAFVEFLTLFKMNGSVWFWNQGYQANVGENREWTDIEAWSPLSGLNSAQMNARNNDVVTRGGVVLSYRNYTFQGYFKSLQWTMDAGNPFQWNFSFVFQVERTVGAEFVPS